jgi:hypothetical protein
LDFIGKGRKKFWERIRRKYETKVQEILWKVFLNQEYSREY